MLASATGYRMSNSTVVRRSLSSALRSSIRPIIASPMVLGGAVRWWAGERRRRLKRAQPLLRCCRMLLCPLV